MNSPAGAVSENDSSVLHSSIALIEQIRAASDEAERGRRLPNHIAAAMKDAGVFGMAMPREWGGAELDPLAQIRVIEALAMADGAVGWCAMINCDGGYGTAFLDQAFALTMYPDIQVATAGAVAPTGVASLVKGGYCVSGRFPFVSGIHHCDWAFLGCIVTEHGAPCLNANGVPETRQCFLKRSEYEILDTWYTTGLCGTGSNDVAVHDVFVEKERTFSFQDPSIVQRAGPLYAFPTMFLAKATAPALGVARHAVDLLIAEAKRKAARRYILGGRVEEPKLLGEDVFVQNAVARAEALVGSARAYVFQVVGDLWSTLVAGQQPSTQQIVRLQTLYPHAVGACAEAVQLVYEVAGGSAVYQKGGLNRCLRDILTMKQHTLGSLRRYEVAGRLILDLDPIAPLR
jgi:indole-3-acetate monooxygenase